MICPNCGETLEDSVQYCPNCMRYTFLPKETPDPLSELPEDEPEDFYYYEEFEDDEYEFVPLWNRVKNFFVRPVTILVVMFALGLGLYIATAEPAASPPEIPWFQVENGLLYFDASAYTGSAELVVPGTIDGQTVTGLGNGCFYDCDGLTTVHLPDTLTYVGESAFADCDSLRGIYLPVGVAQIGANAFRDCAALEAVSLSGNVKSIGSHAFTGCSDLNYIFFNSTVAHWVSMYRADIGPSTHVYARDGVLYQGYADSYG